MPSRSADIPSLCGVRLAVALPCLDLLCEQGLRAEEIGIVLAASTAIPVLSGLRSVMWLIGHNGTRTRFMDDGPRHGLDCGRGRLASLALNLILNDREQRLLAAGPSGRRYREDRALTPLG
jgi:hypothetical protein